VLATRSRTFIDRKRLEPACRAADIVVSDRRLPYWCDPAWLKLDRRTLAKTGAVSIWLGAGRIRTVAADDGRHPWRQAQ
jgi:competence protein ComEC